METKYQLILIGNHCPYINKILDSLNLHFSELGVSNDFIVTINEYNFSYEYKANAPTFCVYFGGITNSLNNSRILDVLLSDAVFILPVVSDLSKFKDLTPENIHKINGFELSAESKVESLVSLILEGLGLLRMTRRLFISYKRAESSSVALQLYEQLEKNGFDVFLDTHSIRPGESFQDELWHRLADTDIVLLLNTPGFLTSEWTVEELAKANAMQIGILQLIWPNHTMEATSALSIPLKLNDHSFVNGKFIDSKSYLIDDVINEIVKQSEFLRARSLAARQDNLITEFMKAAAKNKKCAILQPQKLIKLSVKKGQDIIVIPTVGVPQAFAYNKSEDRINTLKLSNKTEIWLLFDHINIRDNWLKHLDWLDKHLPIKTLRIINAESWLQNI
jgi:hypothetical protein